MALSYLSNVELSELFRHSSNVERELFKQNYGVTTLSDLATVLSIGSLLGYLIAFIIALLICKKQRFYWLNSIISLVIFWIIGKFNLTGWNYLKTIFLSPGELTSGVWYYLINGFLMIGLGVALLFVANKIISNIKKEISINPSLA
jgi:hypothetical protein